MHAGDRLVVDGWLLLHMRQHAGAVVLAEISVLRAALEKLLGERMARVAPEASLSQTLPTPTPQVSSFADLQHAGVLEWARAIAASTYASASQAATRSDVKSSPTHSNVRTSTSCFIQQ